MIVSYDGAYFHGFQRLTKLTSVQAVIENALSQIFKQSIVIKGAGRTDAGVHAKGQVVHFDSEQLIPPENLQRVLNKMVLPHIYVLNISIVDESFHARISAIKKEYRYYICTGTIDPTKTAYCLYYNYPLDIEKIKEAMQYFIGTHDFKSFSKASEKENTVRTIELFELNINNDMLEFRIIGDGFLHNMVRIIMALLVKVGSGKKTPADVKTILTSGDRRLVPFTLAPQGLYLWEVSY